MIMEARLFNRDGIEIHRVLVKRPLVPTLAWLPPREISIRSIEYPRLTTLLPPSDPLLFALIGVEVDLSGRWARYEEQ